MQKDWDSQRTLLYQSQMWNLLSTKSVIERTAAVEIISITTTWRQNLRKLDVTQATMELQVQSWATNSEFGQKCKYESTYFSSKACVIHEKYD